MILEGRLDIVKRCICSERLWFTNSSFYVPKTMHMLSFRKLVSNICSLIYHVFPINV